MNDYIKVSDLQELNAAVKHLNQISVAISLYNKLAKEEPKPTLTEIVDDGKQRMIAAVDCVIAKHEAKHEAELKAIDNRIKLESKSALASIGRYGNCHGDMHSLRMDAMMRSRQEQYLDSLGAYWGVGNALIQAQGYNHLTGIGGGRWI
jgi:hypothetical protein